MSDADLERCYTRLGLSPGCTADEVERAFLRKNFALIKGSDESARAELRAARDAIVADQLRQAAARPPGARTPEPSLPPPRAKGLIEAPRIDPTPADEVPALLAFDNWKVNAIVPPVVVVLAWLVNLSPFGFFLKGFHVWVHELGHATAAWMTGRRALPLPIGWTNIEPPYSPFVYFGLLALFGVLLVAGWRERKIWPVLFAVALAPLQYLLTWRTPAYDQQFWWTFCGIGGEFYLSALFMALFFVQMPEKFRWGACRYVVLFLGASCFLNIYLMWRQVHLGNADIPMGSMVNGEDDAGGDMNVLMSDYHWTNSRIRRTYYLLGNWSLVGLLVVYVVFLFRLNAIPDLIVARLTRAKPVEA